MRDFLWQTSRSQAALVRARDIIERDRGHDHSEEIASFFQERDLYVCVGMISIHTTAAQAFQLWGITGGEIIQLVDIMDTERPEKFSREANLAGSRARSSFESVLGRDEEAHHKWLKHMEEGLKAHWVWRRWRSAWENGCLDMPDPAQVWFGP